MVEFSDIVDAIVTNRGYYPVASGKVGIEDKKLKIENNQSFLINIYGDSADKPRNALIYKHEIFHDDKVVKYVIRCAGHEASINFSENQYGSIEIRNTVLERPHGESIVFMGFRDAEYLFAKMKEANEEYEATKDPRSFEVRITADEWSVDRVLDELLRGVLIAWDDEEWKIDSKMIFNIIKPALKVSILNEKAKWIDYLRTWENYYRDYVKYHNLSEDDNNHFISTADLYDETVSILENKQDIKRRK